MKIPSRFAVLVAGCLLVGSGLPASDDVPKADLKPLHHEVRKLVEKHYPKAKVTLKGQTIAFEFDTRTFMIHEMTRIGDRWQDARSEPGPQPGGIWCEIELRSGVYRGALVTPQSLDKRYFTLRVMSPYSTKLAAHLYVHLKYPRGAPREFLTDFERLLKKFDKHVAAPAR